MDKGYNMVHVLRSMIIWNTALQNVSSENTGISTCIRYLKLLILIYIMIFI